MAIGLAEKRENGCSGKGHRPKSTSVLIVVLVKDWLRMGIRDVLQSLHRASSFMDTGVGSEAVYPKWIAMAGGKVLAALSESSSVHL